MEMDTEKIRIVCRLASFIYLNSYQEKRIKIISQISSGQMLFSPAFRVIQEHGLTIPHSLISIKNHMDWISTYNPTAHRCYLNKNVIVGIASPLSPSISISTIFGLHSKEKIDKDQTKPLTSISEQHINRLLAHIQDDQPLNDLRIVFKKHHLIFDTSITTIAQTSTPHVICTGDHPSTTSRPYPQIKEKQNATLDIIQQMLKNKQIRSSNSQYFAPILLIQKRDGSYRFIVDYRKLNRITIQDNYPLPNLEQTIQMVGGHQYYTKLDLR